MYIEQNEPFAFAGMRLVCKSSPRRFWPCQNCALQDMCRDMYGTEGFPVCSAEAREDRTQVVFMPELQRRNRKLEG